MANRNFNRKQALEKEVKDIYFKVSFGATGAPTLSASDSLGVASIERDAQGTYTVTLDDKYHGGIKFFDGVLLDAAAEDIYFQLKADSVASSKEVEFFCNTGATATDPSDGSVALFKLELKNNTIR